MGIRRLRSRRSSQARRRERRDRRHILLAGSIRRHRWGAARRLFFARSSRRRPWHQLAIASANDAMYGNKPFSNAGEVKSRVCADWLAAHRVDSTSSPRSANLEPARRDAFAHGRRCSRSRLPRSHGHPFPGELQREGPAVAAPYTPHNVVTDVLARSSDGPAPLSRLLITSVIACGARPSADLLSRRCRVGAISLRGACVGVWHPS